LGSGSWPFEQIFVKVALCHGHARGFCLGFAKSDTVSKLISLAGNARMPHPSQTGLLWRIARASMASRAEADGIYVLGSSKNLVAHRMGKAKS
jgi:hypothetical protein